MCHLKALDAGWRISVWEWNVNGKGEQVTTPDVNFMAGQEVFSYA